jgi:hypothetical protein
MGVKGNERLVWVVNIYSEIPFGHLYGKVNDPGMNNCVSSANLAKSDEKWPSLWQGCWVLTLGWKKTISMARYDRHLYGETIDPDSKVIEMDDRSSSLWKGY